jgi:hypothetical protein
MQTDWAARIGKLQRVIGIFPTPGGLAHGLQDIIQGRNTGLQAATAIAGTGSEEQRQGEGKEMLHKKLFSVVSTTGRRITLALSPLSIDSPKPCGQQAPYRSASATKGRYAPEKLTGKPEKLTGPGKRFR